MRNAENQSSQPKHPDADEHANPQPDDAGCGYRLLETGSSGNGAEARSSAQQAETPADSSVKISRA